MNLIEYITGRVYKIQVKDEFKNSANMLSLEQLEYINHIYVGSTKNTLTSRFKHHKLYNKNENNCTSKILVNLFDRSNIEIVLIKEYVVQKEKINYCLLMYETLHMNRLRLEKYKILNKQNSFRVDHIANKDYRINHLERKEEHNKQYYSNNREYFKDKYKENYNNRKNSFKCYTCKSYFSSSSDINRHLQTQFHKSRDGYIQQNAYYCKYCNVDTSDRKMFVQHLKTDNHLDNIKNLEEKDIKDIFRYSYTCKECDFYSDNKKDHSLHLDSETHIDKFNLEKKNKCKICNIQFSKRSGYTRHQNSQRHIAKASLDSN